MKSHESDFERWVRSIEQRFVQIWRLEGDPATAETGLYKTTTAHMCGDQTYYTPPVFHVWKDGKWIMATENYQKALKKWREE